MTMEEQEQLDQVDEHEQEGEEEKLDNVELDNVELENVELEPEIEAAEPVEETQPVPTPTIHIDTPPPLPAKQFPTTPALASASKESFSDVALSRSGTPAVQQPQPQRAGPSRPSSTRPPSTSYHPSHPHSRRSSTATTLSLSNNTQNGPQLSSIIITPPLQQIAASKEAKRSPAFLAAANKALELCAEGNAAYLHPRLIFEPLRMACETRQEKLVVTSLDLMSKLISHSFFYEPYGPPSGQPPLADLIAHTIAITYSETSPPAIALQVVKALLALVLSTKILVHQSSLLKALRTVYNVFLLSTDATNQMVAQGGLTQIVHHVFGRVRRPQRGSISERVGTPVEEEKMTLQTFETPNPNDNLPADAVKVPTDTVPIPVPIVGGEALEAAAENEEGSLDAAGRPIPTEELFVKDAFLVFRALCKLSKTPMPVESERDLKSIDMRSKLLSLHLVLTILKSHADMFVNPAVAIPSSTSAASTQFLQATKQYLCLSLSRNAVSPVIQVFELSVEIFWQVLKTMRAQMKVS
jgi:brefeldin A-inhibited guanine nucleotide-exchange protein